MVNLIFRLRLYWLYVLIVNANYFKSDHTSEFTNQCIEADDWEILEKSTVGSVFLVVF